MVKPVSLQPSPVHTGHKQSSPTWCTDQPMVPGAFLTWCTDQPTVPGVSLHGALISPRCLEHPLYGALISPQCLGHSLHGAKFKNNVSLSTDGNVASGIDIYTYLEVGMTYFIIWP